MVKPNERYFFQWIAVAALADWLITRSLARMAIFMPKSPPVLAAYQGLITAGQLASLLCALLGLVGAGWLAWRLRRKQWGLPSIALGSLVMLTLVFILQAPGGWLLIASRLILLATVLWFGIEIWKQGQRLDRMIALLIPVLAVWAGSIYHSIQALYTVLQLPGPPPNISILFNLGELLAVISPIAVWWVSARHLADRRVITAHLVALVPGVLFLVAYHLNPSMTGILAVWSTGMTLYLPPLLYAASLWLGTAAILQSNMQGSPVGFALLLLASAGYAPQLSSQLFLALLALSLLANHWQGEPGTHPAALQVENLTAPASLLRG